MENAFIIPSKCEYFHEVKLKQQTVLFKRIPVLKKSYFLHVLSISSGVLARKYLTKYCLNELIHIRSMVERNKDDKLPNQLFRLIQFVQFNLLL